MGQLLVLLLLIPLLEGLFRFVVAERMGTIIVSALVAHTAWHWMTDRWEKLRQFPLQWPVWNAAMVAGLMRWLMALLIMAGLIWMIYSLLRQREGHRAESEADASQ